MTRPLAWILVGLAALAAALVAGSGCMNAAQVGARAVDGQVPAGAEHGDGFGSADEYWILAREPGARGSASSEATVDGLPLDELPGTGGLIAYEPATRRPVLLPLRHTDVAARVTGTLGDVSVTQRFQNPYEVKIEAVYVFPLPADAAVRDFLIQVGARTIRGIVRERAEAEQIYAAARRAGHVAALLTEERPNVFTQKIANLEPGAAIDVTLRYQHALAWVDGAFEFVFPTVVGPRYTPPGSRAGASGIGAVEARAVGSSGQPVEVPYLRPEQRSAHDLALRVDVEWPFALAEVRSATHAVEVARTGDRRASVELADGTTLPNRDFVLRLEPASDALTSGMLTQTDERGGHVALTILPPRDLATVPRAPIELVALVDVSGSMKGEPMALARRALHAALDNLERGDAFQLVRFSQEASDLGRQLLAADRRGLDTGHAWIDALEAGGGTEVLAGLHAALHLPRDAERQRILLLVSDGFIANEEEVLRTIRARRGDTRCYALGIGSAPNRFLLDGLASEGRGVSALLHARSEVEAVVGRMVQRAAHPVLTELEIDWGGLAVESVCPRELPELYPGRAVVISARLARGAQDPQAARVRLRGVRGGQRVEWPVPARRAATQDGSLAVLWARMRIADLASQARRATDERTARELAFELRRVALENGLVSPATAFVAVDSLSATGVAPAVTVPVPVAIPAGVDPGSSVRPPH